MVVYMTRSLASSYCYINCVTMLTFETASSQVIMASVCVICGGIWYRLKGESSTGNVFKSTCKRRRCSTIGMYLTIIFTINLSVNYFFQ